MKTKVYVAGPYSSNQSDNVRRAVLTADRLQALGLVPFCPHLYHFQNMIAPCTYDDWMRLCLEWVPVCNCLLRIEGDSAGADLEVELAKQLGLRVYYSYHDLIQAEVPPVMPNLTGCEGGV